MRVKLAMDDRERHAPEQRSPLTVAANQAKHVGNLRIGQATVEWRRGMMQPGNGVGLKLSDLIVLIEAGQRRAR